MKFYRGNRADAEFEMSPQEVATAFAAFIVTAHKLVREFPDNSDVAADWVTKYEHWPLERVLRDWMTHPEHFNAGWDESADNDEFGAIWTEAHTQLTAWERERLGGPGH